MSTPQCLNDAHPPNSLAELNEAVQINIISFLPDPQPLATCSKALWSVASSSICKQLWFQRWWPELRPSKPVVLAALSWHGLRGSNHGSDTATAPGHLVQLVCSTVKHNLEQQQMQKQASRQVPTCQKLPAGMQLADVTRVQHSSTDQQLRFLQQLFPWPEHLFIPAAAAAGQLELLQQLLVVAGVLPASGSGGSSSSNHTMPCNACTYSTVNSSSSSVTQNGAQRLQEWLWQQDETPFETIMQQHQQQQQQQTQQPPPCTARLQLLQRLPDLACLNAFTHNVLQTSLIAAAKGGSVPCLQLLLGLLVGCGAGALACAEALVAVAEAAAAAGQLQCLQVVWQVLRPPGTHGPSCGQQQGAGAAFVQSASGQGSVDVDGELAQQLSHLHLQPQSNQQSEQPQQQVALQQQPQQPVHQQQRQQQQQGHGGGAGLRATHFVRSSTYMLVAAASSGCCQVLQSVMEHTEAHAQKQQLPAALSAAGQGGHVAALQLLLQHPELSARPLQLAASDAALHGWPHSTLLPLLDCMAARFNQELIPLLAKPLVIALQQQQQQVAAAVMDVLVKEAALDQADLLSDALLLLAYQGQTERVSWVVTVAPTVLVKLGTRAVAAALEGGHPDVAQLILDMGGQRPPAFKAAAKRGQLTAAVAAGDAAAVRALLREVRLPAVWCCELVPPTGQGGAAVRGSSGGGAGGQAAGGAGLPAGPAAAQPAGAAFTAGGAAGQRSQTYPTHCLQTLLTAAALAPGPAGLDILQQLLAVLSDWGGSSSWRRHVLLALAKACFAAGWAEALRVVIQEAGKRPDQRRPFLLELMGLLQMPHGTWRSVQQQQRVGSLKQDGPGDSSNGGSGSSGVLDAALALFEEPSCCNGLGALLAGSYLAVGLPGVYLSATARPVLPAAHIPCLQDFTSLLLHLAEQDHVPPGARIRDLPLFRLLVRTVLQACNVDLLYALLLFMQRHGEAVMGGMPEDAMRALRAEAQAAEGGAAAAAGAELG